jgi:type VI secretion system protein
MQIVLKITSYQRLTPGQEETYQPVSDSFTIGRSKENDWAISDPNRFLSSSHCRIHSEDGRHFITDTSTNGVFLNGSERRMERNETRELDHGDRIRIGDYEFEVLLEDPNLLGNPVTSGEETVVGNEAFDDPFAGFGDEQSSASEQSTELAQDQSELPDMLDDGIGEAVSLDSILDLDEPDETAEPQSARDLDQNHSPMQEPFSPSPVQSEPSPVIPGDEGAGAIPDNWDEATGMFVVPDHASKKPAGEASEIPDNWDEPSSIKPAPPTPAPVEQKPPEVKAEPVAQPTPAPKQAPAEARPTPAASSGQSALSAFVRGAGIDLDDLAGLDEAVFFESLGCMMKETTSGLVAALRGRFEVKNEFRIEQTHIGPLENNPLKFLPTVPAVLIQLVSGKDRAFKKGADAIAESFDDINAHQTAVIAGMEAAVKGILARFNPDKLEKRIVSDSVLDNILPGARKAKYWEVFKLQFEDIASEVEDSLEGIFGSEFARAYEEQLHRLKNERKE